MVSCLMLLLLVSSSIAIELVVGYPNEGNFSSVRLTCIKGGPFGDPLLSNQRPATFVRNSSEITVESVVSLVILNDVQIAVVFSAEQEGGFSCRTGGTAPTEESAPLYLAGLCPGNVQMIILIRNAVVPAI